MRRALAFGIAATLATFAACSSFDDGATPPADDAGANDGGAVIDGGADPDDASPDGSTPNGDAEAGGPPGMILVQTSGTSYWIDAREVTTGEFSAFKEVVIGQRNGDAGFPAICSFKSGLGPSMSCAARALGAPVGCVDWCDAFAYCKFAGKRLCGRIGGGSLSEEDAKDRFKAEWVRACTGSSGANTWPYGAEGDASTCNTQESPVDDVVDAGTFAGCTGGEPGLVDMSGNAAELDDSCEGTSGAGDTCFVHGGGFGDPLYSSRCTDQQALSRTTTLAYVGFRCCMDP